MPFAKSCCGKLGNVCSCPNIVYRIGPFSKLCSNKRHSVLGWGGRGADFTMQKSKYMYCVPARRRTRLSIFVCSTVNMSPAPPSLKLVLPLTLLLQILYACLVGTSLVYVKYVMPCLFFLWWLGVAVLIDYGFFWVKTIPLFSWKGCVFWTFPGRKA